MKVSYKPSALKQLKKLPTSERKKAIRKISVISDYPLLGKKLEGKYKGFRSVRAWPYRIIYELLTDEIIIILIEHRQGVYK